MRFSIIILFGALLVASCGDGVSDQTEGSGDNDPAHAEAPMRVHFLEVITQKVDETCALLEKMHGVEFSPPVAELANARVSVKGLISVRAPIPEAEPAPLVRPYLLVDDIRAAVKHAEEAGATIAHPPLEIPGRGTFAIYILGGVQHGLWEE